MIAALVKDETESFISPRQYFPELIRAIKLEREKFGKDMVPQRVIAYATPAATGVQKLLIMPDSDFRRNDDQSAFLTFYKSIKWHPSYHYKSS